MGSSRGIPSCGLFPLNVFCDLLWLWIVIGIGIGSTVWVDEWLASGQEDFDCKTADIWDPAHRLHFGGLFLDEFSYIPQASGRHWYRSCCVCEWLLLHGWLTVYLCPNEHSHHKPSIFSAHIHSSDRASNSILLNPLFSPRRCALGD